MSIRSRSVSLAVPALAIHGGAGARPYAPGTATAGREVEGLRASLAAGWDVLAAGGDALDAVVAAVLSMEDSGVFNAGRGAVPTSEGGIETDAAVMGVGPDGNSPRAGAACAMTWPANPVLTALAVARTGDTLLLAGEGADRFAEAAGLPRRDPALLTHGRQEPTSETGTVGAVAVDADGRVAAATSTGGRRGQRPGRVGDSPVIGAGTWAAQGRVAVSATGEGEAFVQAGFAHLIDGGVRAGVSLPTAARDALAEVERWHGEGGAVVLSPDGQLVVVCDTSTIARGWRDANGQAADLVGPDQA